MRKNEQTPGCDAVEELLPLHAVGDAGVEESLRIEEHVSSCGSCRSDLDFYRRLCATAREDLSATPAAPTGTGRLAPGRRVVRQPLRGLAAAALLVLGVAIGLMLGRWSAMPPTPERGAETPTMPATVTMSSRAAYSVFSPVVRRHLARAARGQQTTTR